VKKVNEIVNSSYNKNLIISEPGKGYKLNKYIDKPIHSIWNKRREAGLILPPLSSCHIFNEISKTSICFFKKEIFLISG